MRERPIGKDDIPAELEFERGKVNKRAAPRRIQGLTDRPLRQ